MPLDMMKEKYLQGVVQQQSGCMRPCHARLLDDRKGRMQCLPVVQGGLGQHALFARTAFSRQEHACEAVMGELGIDAANV
jgi:hypothetical protein